MQEDIYQGDGQNLYAYCGNNPVVYYDPSGYTGTPSTSTSGCGTDAKTDEGQGEAAKEGGSGTNSIIVTEDVIREAMQDAPL